MRSAGMALPSALEAEEQAPTAAREAACSGRASQPPTAWRGPASIALVLLAVLASGCASNHDRAVSVVAEQLHAAIDREDGSAACDLLSDSVQEELQDSGGTSCEVAILEAGISPDGRITRVEVFGTAAQVRYDDDVVFLADFPDGWKVIGAACERQATEPYDCKVHGG